MMLLVIVLVVVPVVVVLEGLEVLLLLLLLLTAQRILRQDRVYYSYGLVNGLSVFAPQVNLNAQPLWGRNMECVSLS